MTDTVEPQFYTTLDVSSARCTHMSQVGPSLQTGEQAVSGLDERFFEVNKQKNISHIFVKEI